MRGRVWGYEGEVEENILGIILRVHHNNYFKNRGDVYG
jgi:hypothetical protein